MLWTCSSVARVYGWPENKMATQVYSSIYMEIIIAKEQVIGPQFFQIGQKRQILCYDSNTLIYFIMLQQNFRLSVRETTQARQCVQCRMAVVAVQVSLHVHYSESTGYVFFGTLGFFLVKLILY